MQNRYTAGILFFIVLVVPLSSVHADVYSDPYNILHTSNLYQGIQQLQTQQTSGQTQAQSNQVTDSRLRSQYGYATYSHCMAQNLNVDSGNPYAVAMNLSTAEACMASYQSSRTQQQTQCSAGYVLVNGTCESGNQGCVNKWGANTIWTGTNCDCASGYQWGGSGNNQCVAVTLNTTPASVTTVTTPTCTANATYNGSQCTCNSGYFLNGGACITGSQSCFNSSGPHSIYNSTDNSCGCASGYVWEGKKCVTPDQSCQSTYGAHSTWNGEKNAQGGIVCDCGTGFDWNSGQTACVKTAPVVVPAASQTIESNSGSASVLNGVASLTAQNETAPPAVPPQKGFWSRLLHALNPFSWF